jgi:peptidoglycan/LPS O-acetylase OafA/YrhL
MTAPTAEPVSAQRRDIEADVQRLPALDGLRGLAILLVMQLHFWGIAFGFASLPPTLVVDRFMGRLFGVGWSGVELFFVLSGFLITGILYDEKRSRGYFRNFYARRFLRIFPLYYAFLAFALLVLPNFHRLAGPGGVSQLRDTQVWYWTYTMNIASSVKQLHVHLPIAYGQFWSLAIEEQFYLLWPLVVLLFSRRTLLILCAALVVGALAVRIFLLQTASASFAVFVEPGVMLPARIDTLALGALLALALRGPGGIARFRPSAFIAAAGALMVLTILFFTHDGLSGSDPDVETIGFSALALLYAALLLLVLTSRPRATLYRVFTHPSLTFLGRYSYAIYVFHLLIAIELAVEIVRRGQVHTVFGSQIPMNIGVSLALTAISVTAAWLSWHLFEKQILKLKRYVPYGREPVIETPPAAAQPGLAVP